MQADVDSKLPTRRKRKLHVKSTSSALKRDNWALAALVGPDAQGLSASTITRLTAVWEQEFDEWSHRSLEDKQYVYVWADGVHFNVRLEEDRQCLLVLMGATAEGKKELIAVADGYRESEQSWKALLLDVKARGLAIAPQLAIGDGALGFWKALDQVFPSTREKTNPPPDPPHSTIHSNESGRWTLHRRHPVKQSQKC